MTRFGAAAERIDDRIPGINLPLLSVSQVHGVVRRSTLTDAPQRAESLDAYKVCRSGDIVFNKMSIRAGAMGVASEDGLVTYHYEVMRPRSGNDPRFIVYLMKSDYFTGELIKRERGIGAGDASASVRTTEVPYKVLRTIDCYVPSLSGQQAIADYLDRETQRIDELIAEQRGLVETLRERRQALVERGTGHGLETGLPMKDSTLEWIAEVPAHWKVANIRRFATMKTGHTPSRGNSDYWVDCTIPWVTLADVWQMRSGTQMYVSETESKISEIGLAHSAAELLPARTVMLSRTASVGFVGIMAMDMATSQDYWNWVCGPALDPEYLAWVLRGMRQELNANMAGSTHKTIYQTTAASFRIPVPPLDEQREIAAYLNDKTSRIDALISESGDLIALSQERRAALITAAVTGQIDVRTAA